MVTAPAGSGLVVPSESKELVVRLSGVCCPTTFTPTTGVWYTLGAPCRDCCRDQDCELAKYLLNDFIVCFSPDL